MPRRAKAEGVIRRSSGCNHLYSDVRVEPDFSRNFKLICPVQISPKKYSAFVVGQISATSSRHPAQPEGRLAIVTDVRRDSVDADALLTNGV
jgi:hypothetical protein